MKFIKYGFIILLFLAGCINKPFQPAPAEFKLWIKIGASEDDIKEAMLLCGYPNVGGFAGTKASVEKKTSAEECMFRKGFHYRDGWKGKCSERNRAQLAACGELVSPKE